MDKPTFMLCPKCEVRVSNWNIMRPNDLYYSMLCHECRNALREHLFAQPITWEKSHESVAPF